MRQKHFRMTGRRTAIVLATATVLAGCGGSDKPATRGVADTEYNDPRFREGGQGKLFGDDGLNLFGSSKRPGEDGAALGVNAYLWRGALDTLAFMPLASADPFGGVIITDWYQPQATGVAAERFKATAYILGRQLRTDAIRVALFRQVQQGSQWVDAPVSPQTVGDLENKVLARARELRASASASN